MRFYTPLLALLSLPIVYAAKASPHQKLVDLASANNGVIELDDSSFQLLTSGSHNWSASIQFTALDGRRRCNPCKEFNPSWQEVAKAWTKVAKKERDQHFFATLDFDNAQATFQKIGLTSAPVVYVYPATGGDRVPASGKTDPLKFDFSAGYDPEPLAHQLSTYTPVTIPYTKPIDWAKLGIMAGGGLVSLLALRFIAPILTNKWVWAFGTVVTSLIMTSGYMFTRIRNAPFNGGPGNWIAAGYQNQYGQEVQVIAGIYGLLALSFLMLTVVVPYQTSASRQRTQIYLWTSVILIVYSMLVSIFRIKNRGYPFKLFI